MNHQNKQNGADPRTQRAERSSYDGDTLAHKTETPRGPVVTIGLSVLAVAFISIFTLALVNTENASLSRAAPAQFAAASYAEGAPEVRARAAIIYDITRDTILFEKNASAQLPLASLTKVLLALVAARELPADAIVLITAEALVPEGDTGFRVGERWKLQDLLDATLIPSSNDGAEALALKIGDGSVARAVSIMNIFARDIGLRNTYFLNPTGLDELG